MWRRCKLCKEEYYSSNLGDDGTCKKCCEKASRSLEHEIDDLIAKIDFLHFWSPLDYHHNHGSTSGSSSSSSAGPCFTDVVLVASSDNGPSGPVPVPAHKAVLVSRSPVFKAMLENEMEESRSGTIKISDVSYDVLLAFVNYLYTAEACLDEHLARDLLVWAEKYQVEHLKTYCEKFLVSKLNWDNSVMSYAFARQYDARSLLEAALSLITDNMDKLIEREEYTELVENDPRLVVEIYEAYLSKQINTTKHKDSAGATKGPRLKPF